MRYDFPLFLSSFSFLFSLSLFLFPFFSAPPYFSLSFFSFFLSPAHYLSFFLLGIQSAKRCRLRFSSLTFRLFSGAFRLYDVDNDGFITRDEMYNIVDAIYQMVVSAFFSKYLQESFDDKTFYCSYFVDFNTSFCNLFEITKSYFRIVLSLSLLKKG